MSTFKLMSGRKKSNNTPTCSSLFFPLKMVWQFG